MPAPQYQMDWETIDEMIDDTPSVFATYTEWADELQHSCYALPRFHDLPLRREGIPLGE